MNNLASETLLVEGRCSLPGHSPIRRIAFYGGPGAGKSTLAAFTFVHLKMNGYSTEMVTECVKKDAYAGRPIEGRLQRERFDEQAVSEEDYLGVEHPADYVITDSPLILQYMYSRTRGEKQAEFMLEEALKAEERFPSLNIFLDRDGVPYQAVGRYQKNIKEAQAFDEILLQFLDEVGVEYVKIRSRDRGAILHHVTTHLNPPTLEVSF